MAIPLTLKVYKGDALVAAKDYERDIIKIGRLASAHLCLDDEKVSRIHSVIEVGADGKLSIIDMGSMEGTYVNGRRVNKGPLQLGDEIRIGSTRIVVEGRNEVLSLAGGSSPSVVVNEEQLGTDEVTVKAAPPPPPPEAVDAAEEDAAPRAPARPHRPHAQATGEVGLQIRFVWGEQLLAVHQLDKPVSFKVGSTPRCQFHVGEAKLGAPELELLKPSGSDFVIRIPPRAVGELDDGTGPVPLQGCRRLSQEEGASTLTLSTRDFAWFDLGGVRVELAFAPMPKKVVVPLSESLDFRFLNLLLLILVAVGAFVISARNLPLDDDTMADDLMKRPTAVAKFILKEEQKKKNPFLEKLKSENKKKNEGEAAAKHSGEEGKMGRKDMKQDTHQRSGVKAIDPNAKDRAKAQVMSLFGGKGGGIQTIFGNGGLGGDLKNAVGNMFGNQVGDSAGLGGMGLKGTGAGGGGMGNTVGIGAIGTHGRGGGFGAYGNGVGNLGGKKDVDIGISNDAAVVMGSLDKELIRQVIHRNRQQIRYCYEMQLTRFPKLEGKVGVQFVISAEGTVAMAKIAMTTVHNPELEQCIVSRFRSWQFPKPKGGGIVQVTYPVVLKQSGG